MHDLEGWARRHVRGSDVESAEDGAFNALVKYFADPQRFDPARGLLLPWLRKCAFNETRVIVRSRRRRNRHEVTAGVDLAAIAAPSAFADDAAESEVWRLERRRRIRAALPDLTERAFADAHLDHEPLHVQAAILGIDHLPDARQRTIVNLWWRRLSTRLKRQLGGGDGRSGRSVLNGAALPG